MRLPARPVVALLRATHPLPSVAVTAFFTALAVAAGVPAAGTAMLAAAVLVGQASVGWANDWIDAGVDRAAARSDKPVATGDVAAPTVGVAAVVALGADVPLSLALGWRAGAAHLVAVGAAWQYDGWLKRTPASVLPFVLSFGLVPVVVTTMRPGSPLPAAAVVAAGGCCGVAAHFANTVKDVEADARTGVRGLPQRVGPTASVRVAGVAIAAAAALLVVAAGAAPLAVAAAVVDVVAAAAVVRLRGASVHAFRLVIVGVAVLVAAFVLSAGPHLRA